jgi:NAD(P)-dependent dehydrogenase (short-subunit alcohol dehydrogenase family)
MNRAGPFTLQGKVAVVTGACGLLGKQHSAALAEAGAHVVVVDQSDAGTHELAAVLTDQTGVEAMAAAVDICSPPALRRLRESVLWRFDRVDILVNNAAINDMVENRPDGAAVPFEEMSLEAWQRSIDVNVTGTFLCCQIFGAEMSRRRSGSIINIASTYGVVAPDQSIYRNAAGQQTMYKSAAYSTSKGAVIALTRHLAAYWGASGVRVNALTPGGVANGQNELFAQRYGEKTPLGRMANPSEYRGAIVFLASEASSYMTGANLVVDGGFTIW